MLMKIGILYFTTCFHGFAILRHVDPFVRMLHILTKYFTTDVVNLAMSVLKLTVEDKYM